MSAALGELVVTGVQKFGPPHVLCYYSAEPVFASSQGNIATVQNSGHNDYPGESRLYFFNGTGTYPTHMVYLACQGEQTNRQPGVCFLFTMHQKTHVSQENWL